MHGGQYIAEIIEYNFATHETEARILYPANYSTP
jgi:hypothetical protein